MKGWPKSEKDVAAPVVSWLQDQQWETYQEVQAAGGIADIVAVQGPVLWVVEVKRTLSLKLIEQAILWRNMAHYRSIAVPWARHPRDAAGRLLRYEGIGLLTVRHTGSVSEEVKPRLLRAPKRVNRLKWSLHDEQKTYAVAGTADGSRFSPFRGTVRRICVFIEKNPGCTMRELFDDIKTHYDSASAGRSALYGHLRTGFIHQVRLDQTERPGRLYLTEAGEELLHERRL